MKKIDVVPYNSQWSDIFHNLAEDIKRVLGEQCVAIHHIGSTSVPHLDAKPIIDIIIEVSSPHDAVAPLVSLGYLHKGEYNIPLRKYFSKKDPVEVHLHVYEPGHPEVTLNLKFRDYLRANDEAREAYAALKYALLDKPESHQKNGRRFTGYNLGKSDFIQSIIEASGFNELCVRFCNHDAEWSAYHRIRQEQFSNHNNGPMGDIIESENHRYFILIKGVTIVSIAHVEIVDGKAMLRLLATDESAKGNGYAGHILAQVLKWLTHNEIHRVHVHVPARERPFYERFGFSTGDDTSDPSKFVTFEKILNI